MTGSEYANLIASYILKNFGDRGIKVYREVNVGKTIIGKNRRIDVLLVSEKDNCAFAIECKYQDSSGTVDEKIPYSLADMKAMRMGGCIVYAGVGFSEGVVHLLQSSECAAFCAPSSETLDRTSDTSELDHILAQHFKWWDVLVEKKKPFEYST